MENARAVPTMADVPVMTAPPSSASTVVFICQAWRASFSAADVCAL